MIVHLIIGGFEIVNLRLVGDCSWEIHKSLFLGDKDLKLYQDVIYLHVQVWFVGANIASRDMVIVWCTHTASCPLKLHTFPWKTVPGVISEHQEAQHGLT